MTYYSAATLLAIFVVTFRAAFFEYSLASFLFPFAYLCVDAPDFQDFCEAYKARLKSSTRSSGFSRPTDSRTVPSVIPAARKAASSMR